MLAKKFYFVKKFSVKNYFCPQIFDLHIKLKTPTMPRTALKVVWYEKLYLDGDRPRGGDRPTKTPWITLFL